MEKKTKPRGLVTRDRKLSEAGKPTCYPYRLSLLSDRRKSNRSSHFDINNLIKSKDPAKMNDADVSKQIQQMVRFIRQEAEEKANEISVSAEEVSLLASQCKI